MRWTLCVSVLLLLTCALSMKSFAADTFPGGTLTGSGGSFVDSNVGTTGETGEPLTLGGGSLNTQWYSWTAPVSAFVSFGTCNPTGSSLTNFDTTIGIYTGTAVNALTQIGFNDDTTGCNSVVNANYGSTVAFTAVAGTTYRIQVDGYANTVGQFNLFYGYAGFNTAVTGATATEGGTNGSFTVVLTAVPTGPATITVGTSPQCTFSPSVLNFSSANWNVPQTVTATAINDAIVEGPHFCSPASLTPSGGGVGPSSAPPPTFNVVDNDAATVSIANTTNGAEAGSVTGVMTVTQSAVSVTNTVVSYTVTGTATSGTDYTALSGTVTIPAGSTTATINIPVINDLIVEPSETVIVTLNTVTSGTSTTIGAPASATNSITSDDVATVSIATTTNGSETGPTNGIMTVTQTAVSSTNTVLSYSVGGTATSGSDFTALSGTVTIPAGSTSATITIPVINDILVEGNETVIITLTAVTSGAATLGTPVAATNNITDNDAPLVTIANTTNGSETGPVNGVFTVTQTAIPTTPIVVAYSVSGTATSGLDYTALSGTVTIPTGSTTATIIVPVINDLIVEGNETVIVTLTGITSGAANLGATVVATNTIADNDSATVSIANTTNGNEAGPVAGVFTVTQTNPSAIDTIIAYSVSGTATSGADYTALSGTVTILAGSTTATINIPVLDDAIVESSETVIVTLTSVTSGLATLGTPVAATNTILDNDTAVVSIANTTDGDETGPVTGVMTVTQTNVSVSNTVIAYSVSGTATSGSDFTALSGTVTIPAGSTTATINIPTLNDVIVEGNETVIVTLTSITSGLATLGTPVAATNTITDNDSATVSIANTTNGNETGPVTGVMTVTQTSVSATNTVIAYSVSGTATSGSDFTALSGTVTIPAGSTTATINIPVLDDAIVDPSETVIITLTSITSGLPTLGTPVAATNTITDNDSATVSIANTTNGNETGPVTGVMTVTQTNVSATNTVIAYSVSGTATSGTDYTALSGTVTILAGATSATINIPTLNDVIVEGNETVIVTLTSITSGLATLGAPVAATNTITDNDSATVSIANTTDGDETGPVAGVMTVTQTNVSATNTVIAYSVSGTATSGSDFTALSGTVTIPAGSTTATINIPTLNDLIVEGNETVIVTLTSVTSGLATLGTPVAATNTITDNDSATVSIANTTDGNETGPVTGVMTVTQTNVSVTNTVIAYSVSGTATSGSDYTALSGTVTILAGATTATINIPTINDLIVEGNETVIVTLTSITSGLATLGTPVAATNTITDNDSATVSIANTTNGNETGPVTGVMTVTQTSVSATNTVIAYSVSGTATSGSDFTALSGTVTIPAGSTTATINIPTINDLIVEGNETVIVTLTSITSGLATLGTPVAATNTITDNDSATVSIANTTNGNETGPVTGVMTVTQTNISATNTVIAYSVSGTATSGSDYTALSGTVTIPAGATTATINIPTINDLIVEGNETVIVTLTSITSGLATLGTPVAATNTITDNDSATVSIANTTNGNETGPVTGAMTVTQTNVSATNTVIAYSVSGTATSGSDYTALSGTVTIPAGSTTATINIPTINDLIVEGSETVIITLTSVTSGLATLGAPVAATNTITDNDSATVSIANTTNGNETGPVTGVMAVTQTRVSATNTVIAYSVSGTATSGLDFTALSGTVTIPAGSTTATINIPTINDLIVEGNETVIVTLTSITSGLATLGTPVAATNTITDNDSATVSIANTTNGNETGPVTGVMTVTQTNVSATNTVIAYSVSGTATSGSDFTALSGTVTIPAGSTTATINIPVIDDAVLDPAETVIITLTSVTSGLPTLGTPVAANNTITDNDVASFTISKSQSAGPSPITSAGQTMTYTVVVTNTGTVPLTGISFVDTFQLGGAARSFTTGPILSGDAAPLGTVNIGETWTYTATYTVPLSDINDTGTYTNSAVFDTAETPPQTSNTVTTNVTRSPVLTLDKTWSFAIPAHDANGNGVADVGDIITYTYVVANTGNVTVNSISISDVHAGAGTLSAISPASVASLNPGNNTTFTSTYVTVQGDIDNQ